MCFLCPSVLTVTIELTIQVVIVYYFPPILDCELLEKNRCNSSLLKTLFIELIREG